MNLWFVRLIKYTALLTQHQWVWICTHMNISTRHIEQITILRTFLAATKQLYEWINPSVCLSVTHFWLCSHLRIIMKVARVITNDKSDVYAKGEGQRSKVKVTEVNTQLSRFRTVTPVWINIWWCCLCYLACMIISECSKLYTKDQPMLHISYYVVYGKWVLPTAFEEPSSPWPMGSGNDA